MSRILVAIVALLLLSGCVTSPRPDGLSPTQQRQFDAMVQEQQWDYSDITDRERPVVQPIEVAPNDVARRVYDCLVDAGLGEGYALDDNGLVGAVQFDSTDDRVAFYICSVSFTPPARYWGYLSTDELNATYDYFQDWLIPCLEAHDYHLPLAPHRDDVASTPGYLSWDPYTELGARITDDAVAALQDECPTVPTWLYD
jgi:hypothetical protein